MMLLMTLGRIDTFIGTKLAFPIVTRVMWRTGSRSLVRFLIFGMQTADVLLGIVKGDGLVDTMVTMAFDLALAVFWIVYFVRPFEGLMERFLDREALPIEIVHRLRTIAFCRVAIILLGVVTLFVQLNAYSWEPFTLSLALYATTCSVPPPQRRRVGAMVKAWMQRAPRLSPVSA